MKNFLFGDYIFDQKQPTQEWTIVQMSPLCKSTEIILPQHVLTSPVVSVDECSFAGNQQIESVTIPESICTIHASAFNGCRSLRELVFKPDKNCLSIDTYAFEGCENLRHVYFHRPVKLYSKAFCGCQNLQIVEGNMQYVGRHAFSNCRNLTSIWFKTEVEIAESAFAFCISLDTIKFSRNIIGDFSFIEHVPKTTKIICPENSKLLELTYLGYNVKPYYEVF